MQNIFKFANEIERAAVRKILTVRSFTKVLKQFRQKVSDF